MTFLSKVIHLFLPVVVFIPYPNPNTNPDKQKVLFFHVHGPKFVHRASAHIPIWNNTSAFPTPFPIQMSWCSYSAMAANSKTKDIDSYPYCRYPFVFFCVSLTFCRLSGNLDCILCNKVGFVRLDKHLIDFHNIVSHRWIVSFWYKFEGDTQTWICCQSNVLFISSKFIISIGIGIP